MGSTASKPTATTPPSASSADSQPRPNANKYVLKHPIFINRRSRGAVGCEQPHGQKKPMIPLLQRKPKPKGSSVRGKKPSKPKKKGKKKQNVASLSVKRNPKYKKVTKSIIGRPSNFQHVSYVGRDRLFESCSQGVQNAHDETLAGQLLDIAARLDEAPIGQHQQQQENHTKHSQPAIRSDRVKSPKSCEPPPPPPPHWSTLALRQARLSQPSLQSTQLFEDMSAYASKKYNNEQPPVEKISISRRRPQRKKNQSSIIRQRRSHYSTDEFGMPPSLRLGPSR